MIRFGCGSGVVVLGLLLGGCTPVSVSQYRSAEPVGKGTWRTGAGIHIPHDGDVGTEIDQSEGAPTNPSHAASLAFDNVDFEAHYGLTDRVDLSAQAYVFGGKIGVRGTIIDEPDFKAALGVNVGGFRGHKEQIQLGLAPVPVKVSESAGTYLEIPATLSIHRGERFAFFFGPVLRRWQVTRRFDLEDGTRTSRETRFWQPGGFVGARFGNDVQISPGVSVLYLPNEHPVQDFQGGTFLAYPWIGVTFGFGGTKARAVPPDAPDPESEPGP